MVLSHWLKPPYTCYTRATKKPDVPDVGTSFGEDALHQIITSFWPVLNLFLASCGHARAGLHTAAVSTRWAGRSDKPDNNSAQTLALSAIVIRNSKSRRQYIPQLADSFPATPMHATTLCFIRRAEAGRPVSPPCDSIQLSITRLLRPEIGSQYAASRCRRDRQKPHVDNRHNTQLRTL